MPTAVLARFYARVPAAGSDAELLARFAVDRDEAAFEQLVARHEPTARVAAFRVLHDPATVADVVQATFLVFLEQAVRLEPRGGLGPWFYGVAHRLAVRARSRRTTDLVEVASTATPPDAALREACDILHAELDRLPERYRLPLLLCYLEGRTRDEAAAELGVSAGTVNGRVRRGLVVLRRRLTARGVSLSVGVLAVSDPPVAGGSVISHIRQGGSAVASDLATQTHVPFPLAKCLAPLALAGVAFGMLLFGREPPAPQPSPVHVAPSQRPGLTGTFVLRDPFPLVFLDTKGKEIERIEHGTNGALSPDGKWLAYTDCSAQKDTEKVIRPRAGPGREFRLSSKSMGGLCIWSQDSKRVLIAEEFGASATEKTDWHCVYTMYEPATGKVTAINLPPEKKYSVTGWSLDCKRLLAYADGRICWLPADGNGDPEFITPADERGYQAKLSPDGTRILYSSLPRTEPGRRDYRLKVMDLETKVATFVSEPGVVFGHSWSPDGTRVAFTWQKALQDWAASPERETHLIVCDADGRHARTITTRRKTMSPNSSGRNGATFYFWLLDWR